MDEISTYSDEAVKLLMSYGPKLVLAILTLAIGWWAINASLRTAKKNFAGRELDESLQSFLLSLGGVLLKTLLVISVAGMIGIEMTSFIAVMGAAGLAVGMALSGSLQNFAGGVMILLFRPFKVGDLIEAQGFLGSVKEIQIFHTILKTGDNKIIIIPNAPLSGGSLINYSSESLRRVDFTFAIGYDDDIDHAKNVLRGIIRNDPRILDVPEPFIAVSELADSSVNLLVRVWVESANFWAVHFDMLETVKKEFDKQDISIPFPQREVHVYQGEEALSQVANA